MTGKGQMRLGAFFNPTGHHVASWRHPRAQADAGINFQHYVEITRTAERGKFDMVFLADNLGVREAKMEALCRSAQYIANFEPHHAALGARHRHQPYRPRGDRLDQLQRAVPRRAQVRLARSPLAAAAPAGIWSPPARRTRRAISAATSITSTASATSGRASSPSVVIGLWDTWDDDAFVRDKETGQFFHPEKLHVLNHRASIFPCAAPLNIPRSPQGHPVIVQAGGSDDMIAVAAEFAEVIFCAPLTLEAAQSFYATLKRPRSPSLRPLRRPGEDHAGPELPSSAAPRRRRKRTTTT